ncbi:MAG: hypothetical protein WAS25_06345 [Geothrix sp.]|uniref:hypothetical protein n=1 Tax=Geothrix sp. TaxID=1962974 RepID=UPI003BB008D8
MARERTLSPEFFTNHRLASCPPLTRLMLQGIWTLADFDGCFEWDPEALAMKLLPRDDFDAQEALGRLERDGFVKSFDADGRRFGYVTKWHDHQDPHPLERLVYPRPDGDPEFCVRVKAEKYRRDGDIGVGVPDLLPRRYPFQQVASKLLAHGQQVVSNAMPSMPSMPSCPSLKDIKDMKDMEPISPSGIEKQRTRATPDRNTPELTQLYSAYSAITIQGAPWPAISQEVMEAIPGVHRCLSRPGWFEEAEELFGLMTNPENTPLLAGLLPAKSGGKKFDPATTPRYLFSDPRRVPAHLKRAREVAAQRQHTPENPREAPPAPQPTCETYSQKVARIQAKTSITTPAPAIQEAR